MILKFLGTYSRRIFQLARLAPSALLYVDLLVLNGQRSDSLIFGEGIRTGISCPPPMCEFGGDGAWSSLELLGE